MLIHYRMLHVLRIVGLGITGFTKMKYTRIYYELNKKNNVLVSANHQ